jgi:hypothetical protein
VDRKLFLSRRSMGCSGGCPSYILALLRNSVYLGHGSEWQIKKSISIRSHIVSSDPKSSHLLLHGSRQFGALSTPPFEHLAGHCAPPSPPVDVLFTLAAPIKGVTIFKCLEAASLWQWRQRLRPLRHGINRYGPALVWFVERANELPPGLELDGGI